MQNKHIFDIFEKKNFIILIQYAQGISSKYVCSNWQNSQITAMIVLSLILHRKCAKKS